MKAYSKFKKTDRGELVSANYSQVSYSPYHQAGGISLAIFGCDGVGDFKLFMNALEAHRLLTQLNDAISAHTKRLLTAEVRGDK